ncbi:hypothetical protein LT875_002478 [Salmonella enterica]|nr:hypothetical protein [Salmonella enterica]
MLIAILVSWVAACALGVFCTWMLRAKAAGFAVGFALVAFGWMLYWLYPAVETCGPVVIP